MKKELSCLEVEVLTNVLLASGEGPVSVEMLVYDYTDIYDLPACVYSNFLDETCSCCNEDTLDCVSEAQIRRAIELTLVQLTIKGLVRGTTSGGYTTSIDFDDVKEVLREKAKCRQMRAYIKEAYNYLEEDELTYILDCHENDDNGEEHDGSNNYIVNRPLISQSIAAVEHNKKVYEILEYLSKASIITMLDSQKVKRKFLPVFAVSYNKVVYAILNPLFKNEFGDQAGLVFKCNHDNTFTIVNNKEVSGQIFELYHAAKEKL